MDTAKLKRFAQTARKQLMQQVSSKIELVLAEESAARRLYPESVKKLQERLQELGQDAVVDQVAYFWFNRFCALRFMDVNDYNDTRVVSPLNDASSLPAILDDAKQDIFDYELTPETVQTRVTGLLNGTETSLAPDLEAYKLLLVNACNHWALKMPFLFQSVNDYTELLLPDDLLSSGSILVSLREAMTEEACESVEVIGWLYQYYITEKREEVISVTKAMAKLTPETLPAATQLFTPHWIVKYVVDNTLGRLWMLNHPESKLTQFMEFYVKPDVDDVEETFIKVVKPEEIKVMDCCVGSGHMLTYAYDLLFQMYLEHGYRKDQIPELILEKNLYGVEIDERAGELASFALMMKARAHNNRFFERKVTQPNICVLNNISFSEAEIRQYEKLMDFDAFESGDLGYLNGFSEADNYGSLIQNKVQDIQSLRTKINEKIVGADIFTSELRKKLHLLLAQYEMIGRQYEIVVTNPPYVTKKNMNSSLTSFVEKHYKAFRNDLYSAFIKRASVFCKKDGYVGLMTPMIWMFTGTYESVRQFILEKVCLNNLVQLEYSGFEGATVPICTFTYQNSVPTGKKGKFIRLADFRGAANQAPKTLEAIQNEDCGWLYKQEPEKFKNIPGSPIAYWVNDKIFEIFKNNKKLSEVCTLAQGLATADNNRFLRLWY